MKPGRHSNPKNTETFCQIFLIKSSQDKRTERTTGQKDTAWSPCGCNDHKVCVLVRLRGDDQMSSTRRHAATDPRMKSGVQTGGRSGGNGLSNERSICRSISQGTHHVILLILPCVRHHSLDWLDNNWAGFKEISAYVNVHHADELNN